ncbi:MAG: hypothetical protein ACLUIT_13230 [Intestinibacter bartlettii]|uniref:hypothetical protein n=1 Tax=Intestinibacter bartlettii TaxID=261299 RepID=UPI0039913611
MRTSPKPGWREKYDNPTFENSAESGADDRACGQAVQYPDIDREYPKVGEEFWNRFRMKSKAAMGWYYIGVKDALQEDFAGIPAYEE